MVFRFAVKLLGSDDKTDWARIPLVGRKKLGAKQGDRVVVGAGKKSVTLKIHQGMREDANKMVARVSAETCRKLGIREGDVVEIESAVGSESEICVIAIDCSISMGDNGKINKVRDAVESFLDEKTKIRKDGDLVGCIGFASEAWTIFDPSKAYKTKAQQIGKINLQWGTNLVKPLDLARAMIVGGKGRGKPEYDKERFARHVILLADGNSEVDPLAAAKACKRAGIVVDTVGVIDKANAKHQLSNLKAIAHETGGKYVDIDQADLNKLRNLFRKAARDKAVNG